MVSSGGAFRAAAILVATVAALGAGVGGAQGGSTSTAAVRPAAVRTLGQTDAWIEAEAEYLSGRDLSVVCSPSASDWMQALAAAGFTAGAGQEYYGFSLVRQGEMYLSPYVCGGLRLGHRSSIRRQDELQVAWSVNVLIHESVHLGRFTTDEALAEACARRGLPGELHRLSNLAYRSAELSRLTQAATWFRRTQATAYQGGLCS
jgi:hypothetical protein